MAEKDYKRGKSKQEKQKSLITFLKKISVEGIYKWIAKAHFQISQDSKLIRKAFSSSGFLLEDAVIRSQQEVNEMEIEMDFDSQRNRRMEMEIENENDGIPCDIPGSILLSTEEFQEIVEQFEEFNISEGIIEQVQEKKILWRLIVYTKIAVL